MVASSQPAGNFPFEDVAAKLAIALAAGLVVGLEREWAQKEIGVRTFSITALLGALASLYGSSLVVVAVIAVLLLVVFLNVHSLLKDRSLELTTSISLISVVVIGALAGQGHYFTTATSAILMTMLLAWKMELARFADALKPEEIRGAVMLGLLSFVIYPLLPDRYIDPWDLFNPQRAWVIVVVIAGIGFVNYGLLRIYRSRGLYYAAMLGGLVNSTASVAELASAYAGRESQREEAISVLLLTNVSMFIRNVLLLAIFARPAVATAAAPLALMALLSVFLAWRRARTSKDEQTDTLHLTSPVSLPRVIKFGLLFLAISVVSALAQRAFGGAGFLVVSAIGGAVSSASTTASAAALASAGTITPETAGAAVVAASIASALVNIPLVFQQTRQRALTAQLAAITLVLAILGGAVLVIEHIYRV